MAIFIEANTMDLGQLCWTAFTYGYVLFQASNFISDGSEMLLLIPELAGLVGGVVLPVLGAVPDGMMVLFSGLGPIAVAQANLSVGVGALAGSTIMLLTVPWFLSIVGGRVDIENGAPVYKVDYDRKLEPGEVPSKLTKGWSLTETGIKAQPSILATAYMMLFTSLTYLVIQIPSLLVDSMDTITVAEIKEEYKYESKYCLIGLIICSIEFCMYLYWQYLGSKPKAEPAEITQGSMISGMMQANPMSSTVHNNPDAIAEKIAANGIQMYMASLKKQVGADTASIQVNRSLLSDVATNNPEFVKILEVFFKKYANGYTIDNKISKREFIRMLEDLHLNFKENAIEAVWTEVDLDNSNYIELKEFPSAFLTLASYPFQNGHEVRLQTWNEKKSSMASKKGTVAEEDDEDEEEEWPEDIKDLDPEDQRKIVLFRAFKGMAIGTLLVLIFSDPMVEVLAEMGNKTGVPAFYISFILAPLASNASELVAAFNYAQKKTSKSITISLATLEGAACMNNTFCLGIFFALIYAQDLCWKFTAETVAILFVEVLMFIFVVLKPVQKLLDGFIVLSLLPISLAIVWVMTNVLGFD